MADRRPALNQAGHLDSLRRPWWARRVARRGPNRSVRRLLAGVAVACTALFANAGASETAAAAYSAAQHGFEAALASGETAHPDQPTWGQAQALAAEAVVAAQIAADAARAAGTLGTDLAGVSRDLRAAQLLSARVHSLTGWYSRAFSAWDGFLAEGGEVSREATAVLGGHALPSDAQLFTDVVFQLAFSRYQSEDYEGANGFYLTLLDVLPGEVEALRWLGRIAFETGDAEAAAGYFQAVVDADPEDESAAYFLQLSRERLAVGAAASDAFREGIALYEAGELADAFAAFQRAAEENPGFIEASVWAGRSALELRAPEVAVSYWREVVMARPDDAGAAWFLEYASAQVQHGVEAGAAYYQGLADYQAGDLEAAVTAFERAIDASPDYLEAWTWSARVLQESDRFEEAAGRWRGVLERDPADERAAWFLQRAELAIRYGADAGTAYFDGAALYLAGDAVGAVQRLTEAVAANPSLAIAWGYLGRIALQEARYEDAADAYQRAADLTGDEDYQFFADEARRLAAPPPPPLVPPPTVLPPGAQPVEPEGPTPGIEPVAPGEEGAPGQEGAPLEDGAPLAGGDAP